MKVTVEIPVSSDPLHFYRCHNCGKDYVKDQDRNSKVVKVIRAGFANIVCLECKDKLDNELHSVARRYLG